MTESIRRQLVVPPYVSAIHLAVGLGMVAAGVAIVAVSPEPVVALSPEVEIAAPSPSPLASAAPREVAVAPEAPAPVADEIRLLFRAGGATYMQLGAVERDDAGMPALRHGATRLLKEEGAEVAIADVRAADVPALQRAWAGKQVVVDGTCRATVAGFAVVSRLTGDTSYAGLAKPTWDAASVMYAGAQLLAARLDGCSGTYARDAALSPVVVPAPIQDGRRAERLARTARSALIASSVGAEAQRSWDERKPEDAEGAWWENVEIDTGVLRHPRTGATLVTVHIHAEHDCGGPDVNLWGLYRAAADGTVSPVHEIRLDALESIERIVDVEGDGELELIGRSWLGDDVVVTRQDGTELDRLDMQFYGCPC
jgi:hypothetical protein